MTQVLAQPVAGAAVGTGSSGGSPSAAKGIGSSCVIGLIDSSVFPLTAGGAFTGAAGAGAVVTTASFRGGPPRGGRMRTCPSSGPLRPQLSQINLLR